MIQRQGKSRNSFKYNSLQQKNNKNILIAIIKLNMPENLVFFVISSLLTASRDLQKNRSIRLIDRKRREAFTIFATGEKINTTQCDEIVSLVEKSWTARNKQLENYFRYL